MSAPEHNDEREFKDIPVRELLATAVEYAVGEVVDEAVNDSITHCIAQSDHDEILRSLTTKLNDFILSFVDTDEGQCEQMVLTALSLTQTEKLPILAS